MTSSSDEEPLPVAIADMGKSATPADSTEVEQDADRHAQLRARLRRINTASEVNYQTKSGELP
ncbi:hypothetical protein [Streptomyces sp. NBRC 109706]|uniref:hypothetical protein n=1 Tax=Streptomyces sp. NBRC 109706 TaxID=1550035 RepID=UPI00131B7106|nr:hypothetical protein [Streptomyces sp. NBRC 109706]